MKLLHFFFILLIANSCFCSKEEALTWGPFDIWGVAQKADSTIELVPIPTHESERRILCSDYRLEGCQEGSGKRARVRLVELILLQYDTPKNACLAALAIGQWHGRNWLLDDVTNEPVLEDFVKTTLEGKKPTSPEDCGE